MTFAYPEATRENRREDPVLLATVSRYGAWYGFFTKEFRDAPLDRENEVSI